MTTVGATWLLASLPIVAVSVTQAAQPLATDDATIVAPKTCQLEAWIHSMHDGREYWAQPACNFTGNLELSVGGAHARPDTGGSSSVVQLQAKTVVFPRTNNAWSFGAVAGGTRDTAVPHGTSAFQTYYAKALASWYPRRDLEIDLDLGAANVHGSGTLTLAGAAIQYAVMTNVQLLAETFRDEPGPGKYQVGVRYIVIPNRFEAYASYGNRFNGPAGQWSAIAGIRIQTSPFLR